MVSGAQAKATLWNVFTALPGFATRPLLNSKVLMKVLLGAKFALNDLDAKLQQYLPQDNGFFLEIGGNDGFSQSNTKYFELYRGWRGILVEPYGKNFAKIAKTRLPSTMSVHAACVPFGFEGAELELTYSNLMTVSSGLKLSLDSADHAKRGARWLSPFEKVRTFLAPAKTLEDILESSGAPERLDFFSLDVEGAELAVLSGVNLDKYRFALLLVETSTFEALSEFLTPHGYELCEKLSPHDYLFRDTRSGN